MNSELAKYDAPAIVETGARSFEPLRARRTDELIIEMWIGGVSSRQTKRNYRSDICRLFGFVGKHLNQITLEDLQAYAQHLEEQKLSSAARRRYLAAVKSLFKFASNDGIRHLAMNPAAAIRLPKVKETLNERILTEQQVAAMIAAATPGRNRLIVELLYLSGMRAEELATLCWRDVQPHEQGDQGGQGRHGGLVTIFGKGEKTRVVRIEAPTMALLAAWRGDAPDADRVFQSRQRKSISVQTIWRIVSCAAAAGGIRASTHWLRHAHATHAIDHGCDLRTLQQSLGHKSSQTTERYVHSRPRQSSGAFVQLPNTGDSHD